MDYRYAKLILTAPLMAVAACTGTYNRGIEPAHQPVVHHENYAFDVVTNGGYLAAGEDARLQGWLASMRLGYGDHVAVDDPAGVGHGARAQIAGVLGDYGMFLDEAAPITQGEIAPGSVRVVVIRSSASVPGCPDFSRDNKPNFESHTSSNFGCGVNGSLAAMVANPDDLVRGQPGAHTVDTRIATKAIETLRKAPNTGAAGLKSEGTTK
ncbi:CpaD family pilus assembly protein [Sphingomonas sp. GlSt437]|uniref:CpaD family pilus assembly protein n=1 Tax=Sphingomonas sp. GlSt437 TaxID=3389970 RepID=UPI003A8BCA3D